MTTVEKKVAKWRALRLYFGGFTLPIVILGLDPRIHSGTSPRRQRSDINPIPSTQEPL